MSSYPATSQHHIMHFHPDLLVSLMFSVPSMKSSQLCVHVPHTISECSSQYHIIHFSISQDSVSHKSINENQGGIFPETGIEYLPAHSSIHPACLKFPHQKQGFPSKTSFYCFCYLLIFLMY